MADRKASDQGSDAIERNPDPQMAEEMRKARRDQSENPSPEDKEDFTPESTGDAVWVTNINGGTHDVPGDWVTEDDVGVVRVRGNLGYRYASDKEISEARKAQGLDGNDPEATEGSHSANADGFSVEDDSADTGSSKPQTAKMGTASVGVEGKSAKGS